ncbi:type II toxin-antitoxin system Phd/YefM family antitoxin [Fimbriimonas ginsengisoli]|uniref:Antitoxin n=1 Tax=Fimbriimonas ginsengisoli Gsoil 348 TaxID=661478 RepID=A0A068NR32_FIMGI|nr:type II toxin-antitoxin system prevent-host-death family antitoxin [Fimbriimonas ginsengisoli]AIE85210.1 hypothetical protein OP10G_1842 [Fimbriimonas ginsengisoli Gsoil 348]
MDAISYSAARAKLARVMDQVCENREPMIITRQGSESVVILSLSDYEELDETAYLRRSPENARRLTEAIKQLEAGNGIEMELKDLTD